MKLEVRLGAADGHPPRRQPGALGQRQQRVRARKRRGARAMHDHAPGARRLVHRPLARHPWERVTTGPADGVERFELERRGLAQHASDDQRIAPSAAAPESPHPGQIARLEKDDQRRAGERDLGVAGSPSRPRSSPASARCCARRAPAGPPCIQRMSALPLRTFQIVPAANQATTATATTATSSVMAEGTITRPPPAGGGARYASSCTGCPATRSRSRRWRSAPRWRRCSCSACSATCSACRSCRRTTGCACCPGSCRRSRPGSGSVLRERELGSDHEHHLHGV